MASAAADALRGKVGTVTTFDQMLTTIADALDPPTDETIETKHNPSPATTTSIKR